jgi:urease accessory protein
MSLRCNKMNGAMSEAALTSASWEALLRLELRAGVDRTRLVPIERYGPLSVQRPFYPEQDVCHVYLLHPPGGVVGGDRLELHLDLKNDAQALFTTPGAGKFYLSAGDTAQVYQQFEVRAGASLEFLPQENIYFTGAKVDIRTALEVDADGAILFWEKHCFGRPANAESFASGSLVSQIDLRVAGKLLFTEKQRVDSSEIERSSGLRNHVVSGSFLVYAAEFEAAALQELQALQPQQGIGGISRPHPGLLIARFLGDSTRAIDDYFTALWQVLRPHILQREACRPRIWNT